LDDVIGGVWSGNEPGDVRHKLIPDELRIRHRQKDTCTTCLNALNSAQAPTVFGHQREFHREVRPVQNDALPEGQFEWNSQQGYHVAFQTRVSSAIWIHAEIPAPRQQEEDENGCNQSEHGSGHGKNCVRNRRVLADSAKVSNRFCPPYRNPKASIGPNDRLTGGRVSLTGCIRGTRPSLFASIARKDDLANPVSDIPPFTMSDWSAFRALFPALEGRAYLNTAGGGAMAGQTAEAAHRYYRESVAIGDIGWDTWLERAHQDRRDVARFVGGDPDRLAFLPNASLGFNILALSLGPQARVMALDQEFPSCTTPFIRAGADVHFVDTPPDGSIHAEHLDRAWMPGARAFVISSVQYANGFRADLKALSEVCHRHDAFLVVDATQSIGAFPLHVGEAGIDALVFSGYKWATAGYGNAALITGEHWPDDHPPLIGWRSARDAYALENDRLDLVPGGIAHEMGHPPFPGLFALAEALRVLDTVGPDAMARRILGLTGRLLEALDDRSIPVRSARNKKHRSGIVLLDVPHAKAVCSTLKQREIWTSARDGGLRVSLHGYNDASDIERLLEGLDAILD